MFVQLPASEFGLSSGWLSNPNSCVKATEWSACASADGASRVRSRVIPNEMSGARKQEEDEKWLMGKGGCEASALLQPDLFFCIHVDPLRKSTTSTRRLIDVYILFGGREGSWGGGWGAMLTQR